MNHLQIIQDILASATATPVAPLQMYQGEALPYVVYDVTANPENTKAVVTGLDIITLNVYIFNNDLDEAQTTANLIRQALTTQKNTGVQSAALNYFDFDYVDQINSNLILQTYNVRMAYTGNIEPLRALYTLLAEASATLTVPSFLAANYTLSGAVTANITVTKLLAGTYSLSATASAALRVGSELAGSYTLNAAASAALIVAKQFAGTYSLTASSNAALIVQKLMAGGYTLNAALSATVDTGATAWLPSDLASLAAWYDASDTSTITHSAGAVSQIDDKEGTNHLTQGNGAWQPTTGVTTQNALNVLDFSTDFLTNTTGFTFLNNIYSASTIFYVVKGAASSVNIVAGLAESGTNRYWAVDYRASPKRIERINTSIFLDPATQLPNNGGWVIIGTIGNGTTESGYVDGAANGSITLSGSTETNGDFTIGGPGNGNNTIPLIGSIAEIIVCNTNVSSTDREKIEGYLAHKWGLTANLPSGHPYKSVAP